MLSEIGKTAFAIIVRKGELADGPRAGETRRDPAVRERRRKEFVSVRFKDENFWLTQKAMGEWFGCTADNISPHLKNIFAEDELDKDSVAEKFSVAAADGEIPQGREVGGRV